MSKKVNPTLVGLFVVTGVALFLAALLTLGSGDYFREKREFILYFNESVHGLQKGAPVKFKGVTIGSVQEIRLNYDAAKDRVRIPVKIEVETDAALGDLELPAAAGGATTEADDLFNHLIGRLNTDSLVTGRIYIGLRYDPDERSRLEAAQTSPPSRKEIPTEPSSLAEIMDQIQSANIPGLVQSVKEVVDKVNAGLDAIQFPDLNRETLKTLTSVRKTIDGLQVQRSLDAFNTAMAAAKDAMATANRTLASAEKTSDELRGLTSDMRGEIRPLTQKLGTALDEAGSALQEFELAAAELRRLASPQSPARQRLTDTLDEVKLLARSIRELTDRLNRTPDMLLRGRRVPDDR